eukprot:3172962-Rhodomonas_salina.1
MLRLGGELAGAELARVGKLRAEESTSVDRHNEVVLSASVDRHTIHEGPARGREGGRGFGTDVKRVETMRAER